MALFKKKKKEEVTPKPFEERKDLEKLSIFITIVDKGQGEAVLKLFDSNGVAAQVIQRGRGTATKQMYDILGVEDNKKDIVFSVIKQSSIPDAKKDLEAFFAASKRNKGIGFSIPMTSIIGVSVYQFLTDSL